MTKIIDTNHDVTGRLSSFKALGIESIGRYINPSNPSGEKTVKAPEARAIAAAGMKLFLVCEGWGGSDNFAHHDINAATGKRDAEFCIDYAEKVGAPTGACIYFAIDTDASQSEIKTFVLPYFQAISDAFADSDYRIGAYSSGDVLTAVDSLVDLTWLSCSLGWSGSRDYLNEKPTPWAIRQHTPQTIAGIDTDPDDANGDIGDFVPFSAVA